VDDDFLGGFWEEGRDAVVFVEILERCGVFTCEVLGGAGEIEVAFCAREGDEENAEAFVFGDAGMADECQVFGEGEGVVVASGVAPSGVVDGDEEDVGKLKTFAFVDGEDRDGIFGGLVGRGINNRLLRGLIGVGCCDEVREAQSFFMGVRYDGFAKD